MINSPKPATKPADTAKPPSMSLVRTLAAKWGVDADKLLATLKDTAFKAPKDGPPVTDAQMMALLVVSNEYGLNPFTKEIYAFPAKGGGIVPIISIDGWIRIVNERPELDSIEFDYSPPDESVPQDQQNPWISCTITRKDRSKPIVVREYLAECFRKTEAWEQMPHRMLRHKAFIQCARVAFGYGGIYDPDEAERIRDAMAIDVTPTEIKGKPTTNAPKAIENKPDEVDLKSLQAHLAQRIDQVGVPLTQVLGHYEKGSLEEFSAAEINDVNEWLGKMSGAATV